MRRPGVFPAMAAAAALLAVSCGRSPPGSSGKHPDLDKEMDILLSAIKTTQERYVDEDKVKTDQLIYTSLKGMIQSIDPHASIVKTGDLVTPSPAPPGTPLVEIEPMDQGRSVVVRIYRFDADMRKQWRGAEAVARKIRPAGIILDVRAAPGDDYRAAAAVAEWFLPSGSVAGTLVEKQGAQKEVLTTRRAPVWETPALWILTDREMSGPAEMLAAALRYHQRALLVGETTRGVAVRQTPIKLNEEWSVLLTTGRVLDPDGRDITGHPLQPDVAAEPGPEEKENVDWIFHRGMQALRERLAEE